MPVITVVAKLVAKKESIESVKSELLKLITPTRKEEGCINYDLHQDNENPAIFIFYENWESASCMEKHISTDHCKSYVRAVESLIDEKVIHKMTRIE